MVGATESWRPDVTRDDDWSGDCGDPLTWGIGYGEPIRSDHPSGAPSGMAAFSSRGPTSDGRVKPDLVAPGTNVLSVRPPDSGGPDCGVPPDRLGSYVFLSGTSMATPQVAAAAVLARQRFEDGWQVEGSTITLDAPDPAAGFSPSAALVKALLLSSAHVLGPGQYATPREIPAAVPNHVAGWGRVDVTAALFPHEGFDFGPGRRVLVIDERVGLADGESREWPVVVTDGTEELRATLAWTDPEPTPGAAAALVNDLDLTLTTPSGTILHPFGASVPNRRDTVEDVRVAAPVETGLHRLLVEGFAIPGNVGAPGSGRQPFALVVSGGLEAACPAPAAVGATLRTRKEEASASVALSWEAPEGEPRAARHRVLDLDPAALFASGRTLGEPTPPRFVDAGALDRAGSSWYRVAPISACGAIGPMR